MVDTLYLVPTFLAMISEPYLIRLSRCEGLVTMMEAGSREGILLHKL